MVAEIERTKWSIVLIGSFNPAIFHPSWFELHEVISKEIAAFSKVGLVHDEVSVVTMGELSINVDKKRFQIETDLAPDIRILDFVSKVFGDILPHSHIDKFGINKSVEFRTSSPQNRVNFGRQLAPTEPWGEFGERISRATGELIGGMNRLDMREMLDDTDFNGHLEARLEPSSIFDRLTGVNVLVNRHVNLKEYSNNEGARRAVKYLTDIYDATLVEADKIINHLTRIAN